MWLQLVFLTILTLTCHRVKSTYHHDPTLFRVQWTPLGPDDDPEDLDKGILISTPRNEQYYCSLPPEDSDGHDQDEADGVKLDPFTLLQKLHSQKMCTYRIEMYWTYELCHGRYLRQYHEEKHPSTKEALQEYYLGHYVPEEVTKAMESLSKTPETRKIDDRVFPFIPVKYTQGTVCDINGSPRTATILYMCLEGIRNQIYSVDEVSSCEYEVVVFTSLLCAHPAFKPQEKQQLAIRCSSVEGSPSRPKALDSWNREMGWASRQYGIHARVFGAHGQSFLAGQSPATPEKDVPKETPKPPVADTGLNRGFLSGEYCLYGGSGWWKHEYCHGKQVIQFHEDQKSGSRQEILLGVWNHAEHMAWLKAHPHKRPIRDKGRVLQVSHYYGNGDKCQEAGSSAVKYRFVEVRLRCRLSAGSPNSVTLYLMEPKTCEYILGVESQMLCDIIQTADDDAMFFNVD